MSDSDSPEPLDRDIVSVTEHGEVTIPKRFRDTLGLDVPGMVQFRMTSDGAVVVERVRTPSEMRGFSARYETTTEDPATSMLDAKRLQDRTERDRQFDSDQQ